jgi:hypothetical protein
MIVFGGKMSELGDHTVSIERFIRKLPGKSQPILVEATDGRQYVAKFGDEVREPNVLFNESLGAELYGAFHLPVPPWRPLRVTSIFVEGSREYGTEIRKEFIGRLCFGSRFLGGGAVPLFEILPSGYLSKVRNLGDFALAWIIDVCAGLTGRREAVFRGELSDTLEAVFIDFGEMFGNPSGELSSQSRVPRYVDPRVYQTSFWKRIVDLKTLVARLDADRVWLRARAVPGEWITPSALRNVGECLERLSTLHVLERVLEAIERASHEGVSLDHRIPLENLSPYPKARDRSIVCSQEERQAVCR